MSTKTQTKKKKKAKALSSRKKALLAVEAGMAMKAQEPVVLRVGKLVDYTDYFVIMHGDSTRQVQAIFESILAMIAQTGIKPLGVEGEREGRWVVIDWDDVVIHIFYKELRDFYELEKLWGDAPRMKIPQTSSSTSEDER